jgi:tetratricopeptide (TPR) repeat protein
MSDCKLEIGNWKLKILGICAGALVLVLGAFAWSRVGALDLPAVPAGLTLDGTGLAGLKEMKQLNDLIWSDPQPAPSEATEAPPAPGAPRPVAQKSDGGGSTLHAPATLSEAASLVRRGLAEHRHGNTQAALESMRQGIRLDPGNLVFANAYRMVVFGLRRDFLAAARREQLQAPQFPSELDHQPIAFFEELDRSHPSRETKLHLAMAWVDEMLLFPALEIKAPSSVQAVDLLTQVIDHGSPGYVPALFARGLNHLHRPARLIWPESAKTRTDAAAQDIGRCVAIGRHFGEGSSRLKGTLALSLGDAYVKTGRLNVARSWWQIAQNLCRDSDFQTSILRRYAWQNEEILDRLEEELDRGRAELEHPMTDLALMWN